MLAWLNRIRSTKTRNTYAAQLGVPLDSRAMFPDAPISIRVHYGTAKVPDGARTPKRPSEPHWSLWIPWCRARGYDPLASHKQILNTWLHEQSALVERGEIGEATRRQRHNVTSAFLTWARDEGYAPHAQILTRDDRRSQELLGNKSRTTTALTPAQTHALRHAAGWDGRTVSHKPGAATPQQRRLRSRVVVALLHGAGLRVGELCALNVDDYRRPVTDGVGYLTVRGKGSTVDEQPLPAPDADLLDDYLARGRISVDSSAVLARRGDVSAKAARTAPLVTGDAGQRVGSSTVRHILHRLVTIPRPDADSEIERADAAALAPLVSADGTVAVHPHQLRHAAAQEILAAGDDAEDARAFLRHANIATTNTYLSSRQERLAAVADRLGAYQHRGDDLALITSTTPTTSEPGIHEER